MTTKEMIEVMQAYDNGEQIEGMVFNGKNWEPLSNPSWDWNDWNYRIKPKPLTREEITAQWVKDNNVKVRDFVKIGSRGVFEINEICANKILIDLGAYKDFFEVEELKKVTPKIVNFEQDDHNLFLGKPVRIKNTGWVGHANWCGKERILIVNDLYTYEEAFHNVEFIDGKPFGKEIWE